MSDSDSIRHNVLEIVQVEVESVLNITWIYAEMGPLIRLSEQVVLGQKIDDLFLSLCRILK